MVSFVCQIGVLAETTYLLDITTLNHNLLIWWACNLVSLHAVIYYRTMSAPILSCNIFFINQQVTSLKW